MSNYELTGTVHKIGETQTFASGFTKREFVVETNDEKYPQTIKLEATKDGCGKLDNYQEGDPITVGFNLRGNEYNGKYYVSLSAWKFDRSGQSAPAKPPTKHETAKSNAFQPQEDDDDSIPF